MKLSKEFTTVTPLSKALALTLFLVLPIVTFSLGMSYQSTLQSQDGFVMATPTPEPTACTLDVKICPDGKAVGRVAPNCEFEKCLETQSVSKVFTGTITNINYGCFVDGECSVQIGKGSVVLEKGRVLNTNEVKGSYPAGILIEANKKNYVGKQVEVYAASVGGRTDMYTLFGSKTYYIKIIEETAQTSCGGITGKMCQDGYYCKYDGTYPDASGTCIKTSGVKTTYTCPKTQYVDCMPGPGKAVKTECSSAFLKWAESNCPGFQGAAL